MDATSDSKHPRASFDIVDELGRPIEQVDLTGAVKDNSEKKKEKPAIEFGAVTFASSTLLLAQNQPEKKMTATITTPDAMKADSRKLTPTPNSNSYHLTSSQQTNKNVERAPTPSHPVQRSNPPPSSSKLKRLGPLTNDESKNYDNDDDGYIDIDAPPPPKKPRLFPSPQTTTTTAPSNPTPYPVTTTTADPSPDSLQRSLAAATDQIKRERARRRKAERRAAEYAQHGAPVMRTAARLARWVVDMYAEHRQQQLGGRRDDEVEAFLGEIRGDVGTKAWGRLLWLGGFLRDNLDEGEEGGEGVGVGVKNGAAKLEKEMNKEAAGGDGATDGGKVAEVGESGGGGAVAKGTTRLEDEVSMKDSVSL
ncbi:uncharacterized protein LTHEOB_1083 [Lasiodiplodia theobromae]|uniref:uncharacterized protein n=1 Tax=Lasiodiplodia theobromae TaxID=45133 RepID=UPI0015C32569|nr:uncharacterized protein LTHEOB_1083 [Lasiodiplodia theobromae]KAF4538729.1 hypothetical protein LTHEOB_1083 [Lasiodiplodia theobromae]